MKGKELYEQRVIDARTVADGGVPSRVPTMIIPGSGLYAYGGTTLRKALDMDPVEGAIAFTKIYDDMWTDLAFTMGWGVTQRGYEAMGPAGENFIGPDDVTIEHKSNVFMRDDEYELLSGDVLSYVKNILIPRKYSWLFEEENKEKAVKALETVIDDTNYVYGVLNAAIEERYVNEYGIVRVGDDYKAAYLPIDDILYNLRGFAETLVDLRRRKDKVMKACESLWEIKKPVFYPAEGPLMYATWYPIIPTYLSPKQFEEIYWPYFKQNVDIALEAGVKNIITLEGEWLKFGSILLDLPRYSCIMEADDDDVVEMKNLFTGYQAVAGGVNSKDLASLSKEECLDGVRRIMDECAPGGGFIYGNGKAVLCPIDANRNLVDTFNLAHELGKY